MPSHGLFARYGYSGSDAWSREYRLSVNKLSESKSLYIAGFAFDVLTLAALICGIVWACMIRNHRGALKGVLTSLFTWLIAMVLIIIEECLFLADVVVTQYYLIDLFLYDFFYLISQCMLIFVFYNIIHKLLDRLTDSGRPYAAVVGIHWTLLVLAVGLSVASFALYVAYEVKFVQHSFGHNLGTIYTKVGSARTIFFWLISLEILAWSIFATVRAGSHRFASRMPALALIIGSVFWFAVNMMWAVVSIRYSLRNPTLVPRYLPTLESVCQFFFCVGIYVGILTCCMKWGKLGGEEDKPGPTQYGAVPAGYAEYPGYAIYPHFSQYSQQYPPHMQQPYVQQPYHQPPQQVQTQDYK